MKMQTTAAVRPAPYDDPNDSYDETDYSAPQTYLYNSRTVGSYGKTPATRLPSVLSSGGNTQKQRKSVR